ncbi:hypothetical protein M2175_001266 [Bradyrhizobium elkanii]|nr:hypothetical protein [Bradyrhizobium elkanii]MCS3966788.1 hypothetical protein [Bradyrhizobium japonicum]
MNHGGTTGCRHLRVVAHLARESPCYFRGRQRAVRLKRSTLRPFGCRGSHSSFCCLPRSGTPAASERRNFDKYPKWDKRGLGSAVT